MKTLSLYSVILAAMIVGAVVSIAPVAYAADLGGDMGWYDYGTYDTWSDYGSYDTWSDYGTYDTDGWSDYGTYGGYTPGTWQDEYYTPGTTYDDYHTPGATYDDYYTPGTIYDDYYTPGYGGSSGCYNCGLFNWSSQPTGYSTGGGYLMGGGSYTTPGCTGCGGTSYSYPRVSTGYPVTISQPGGGSQSQSQSQSSNNTNNNTNVNINNNTAVAVAQVQIGSQQAVTPPAPTYPAPYCTIYQAQSYATGYGTVRPVYLSWSSSNAQSAYLSNYGSVSVNGSQTVYPTYTTTYTLTVYGYNGQQATCQTTVYGTTYVPTTPTTPYVSLTQIPYTGFDFGPVGNAMYWAGLAIIALGGAYLAVYFVPQLAFARSSYKRTFAPVVASKAPILLEKEAAEAKVQSIVESLRKNGTTDSMAIVHVKGSMPRIVIDRS